MSAPLLDFPRINDQTDDELLNSRLAGESDRHYFARLTRIYISKWLDASRDLESAKLNGNCSEVLRRFETYERKTKHSLETYSSLLTEALNGR